MRTSGIDQHGLPQDRPQPAAIQQISLRPASALAAEHEPDRQFLRRQRLDPVLAGLRVQDTGRRQFLPGDGEAAESPEVTKFIETAIIGAKSDGNDLVGVYDRYQYSSIYKGSILRSAYCIYRNNDFYQHYYIERFPSYDAPDKIDYVFKYYGFVFPVAGRVFSVDFERIQRNELTFGVFAPVQRSSKKFMFGITSGIAATMFRQPYSTKVALHYRGPGLIGRQQLESLTVLNAKDPSIPKEALQFLGDGSDMIQIM